VHSGWRNTVAPNAITNVVTSNGVGHRNNRALAGGISKAVHQAGGTSNRGHVQYHATALHFHVAYAGENAVVIPLHIHAQNAVKILFRGVLDVTYLRNAGIVYEDVEPCGFEKVAET